ncbi:MAG: hypothetical protein CME70_05195 [Halobacteriovorax sp.]|nr:hypothetical protein [Halobacteriovorax sp.]
MDLTIILPTFNEAKNLPLLLDQILNLNLVMSYEVIIVDDNSSDGTGDAATEFSKKDSRVRLITRYEDPGLIQSIQEGIRSAKGKFCIWMDADLSMSPKLIPIFFDELNSGVDLVLGSRYIPGGGMKGVDLEKSEETGTIEIVKNLYESEDSLVSAFISKYGNILLRYILHPSIHDYSSGYFGGKKSFLLDNLPRGTFVDYCQSLPYKAIRDGYIVKEVPMVLATRVHGISKTSNSLSCILKIGFQCFSRAIWLRLNYSPRKGQKRIYES